ncbi:5'-nucleotidase SurE [Bacteroidia bacterium]|nr:5'-nucleotidase SurE [Bacteroidia bacterium]
MKKKPLILLTNDDGVEAKGLQELTESLKGLGELVVFAPDGPRSGMSGAITSMVPLKYKQLSKGGDVTVYSCTGTPVDCVKLAIHTGIKPDLLVSGINHGGNMSVCVHYSGTMGAAIEGCILGIPSLGVSLCHYGEDGNFRESCRLGRQVIDYILEAGLPEGSFLNLNVPSLPQVKGIKVCRQADARFISEYIPAEDGQGHPAYQLTGDLFVKHPHPGDDTAALDEGYASLVPCKIDVTDYGLMKGLEASFG